MGGISTIIGNGGGSGPAGGYLFNAEQLTYTDDTNFVIGPLVRVPNAAPETSLFVIGGVAQEYGVAYTVRSVSGGTAPGAYVCIATGSTAPGGGAFSGGANPTVGIDSVLTSGDKVRVVYPSL